MKRKISVIIVLLLIASSAFLFTGCTNKSVEEARALVDEYYENFRDNDAESIVDMCGDSLLDYLGGARDANVIFGSRIAVLGEGVEYKVTGTSYNKENGAVTVIIDVEATYDRDGETYAESFQMEQIDEDEDMIISDVSLEREKVVDTLPQDFVDAFNAGDMDEAQDLFADAFFNYYTDEDFADFINSYSSVLGKLDTMEITDEYAYCMPVEEDGVLVVQKAYYDAAFENGTASMWMQLCKEDGEIKIYDIYCVPDFLQELVDSYYSALKSGDYESAADLYDESFYDYIEGGREGWIEVMQAVNSYGVFTDSTISYWLYFEYDMEDGSVLHAVTASVSSNFGDTPFYDEITVSVGSDEHLIFDHSIEIDE